MFTVSNIYSILTVMCIIMATYFVIFLNRVQNFVFHTRLNTYITVKKSFATMLDLYCIILPDLMIINLLIIISVSFPQ